MFTQNCIRTVRQVDTMECLFTQSGDADTKLMGIIRATAGSPNVRFLKATRTDIGVVYRVEATKVLHEGDILVSDKAPPKTRTDLGKVDYTQTNLIMQDTKYVYTQGIRTLTEKRYTRSGVGNPSLYWPNVNVAVAVEVANDADLVQIFPDKMIPALYKADDGKSIQLVNCKLWRKLRKQPTQQYRRTFPGYTATVWQYKKDEMRVYYAAKDKKNTVYCAISPNVNGGIVGLFAARDLEENDLIAAISSAPGVDEADHAEKYTIDIASTPYDTLMCPIGYINDARGSLLRNNVGHDSTPMNRIATRAIREGEELLMSYGETFWEASGGHIDSDQNDAYDDVDAAEPYVAATKSDRLLDALVADPTSWNVSVKDSIGVDKKTYGGVGVYATKAIDKGTPICSYGGVREKVTPDYNPVSKEYAPDGTEMSFVFHIDDGKWAINANNTPDNVGRQLNHSKNPNVTAKRYVRSHTTGEHTDRKTYIIMVANQNINPKEELTFDYGERTLSGKWPWMCETFPASVDGQKDTVTVFKEALTNDDRTRMLCSGVIQQCVKDPAETPLTAEQLEALKNDTTTTRQNEPISVFAEVVQYADFYTRKAAAEENLDANALVANRQWHVRTQWADTISYKNAFIVVVPLTGRKGLTRDETFLKRDGSHGYTSAAGDIVCFKGEDMNTISIRDKKHVTLWCASLRA